MRKNERGLRYSVLPKKRLPFAGKNSRKKRKPAVSRKSGKNRVEQKKSMRGNWRSNVFWKSASGS